jgi:hypothetical protein
MREESFIALIVTEGFARRGRLFGSVLESKREPPDEQNCREENVSQ